MTETCEKWRLAALVACVGLFLGRVLGQIEVLLLQPSWLPPMSAWYSGLLPYPVLLPVQIALLMLMSIVVYDHWNGSGALRPTRRGTRSLLRWIAVIYATVMLVRLLWALSDPPHELLASGVIPVVFHWVLAVFILLASLTPLPPRDTADVVSAEELFEYPSLDAERLLRARRLLDV